MGHHKTFTSGEKIPTKNINYWRDYREYDTYAEIVAACSGFGASDQFKRFLCVADGYEYYWNGTALLRIPGATGGGGSAAKGAYSYLVYKSGSDYYAEDNEGNLTYGGSGDEGGVDGGDALAVLQACVNNGPSQGNIIHVEPPFATAETGKLLIQNKSNLTIYSHTKGDSASVTEPVYIGRLLVESSTAAVERIIIQGITVRDVEIHSNNASYGVGYVFFEKCDIYQRASDQRRGVVLNNDAGTIMQVYFTDCTLFSDGQAANYGLITPQGTGIGTIHFRGCWLQLDNDNLDLVYVGAGNSIECDFDHCIMRFTTAHTGYSVIKTDGAVGTTAVRVNGGIVEFDSDTTFVEIAASGSNINLYVTVLGQLIIVDSAATLTLINNLNSNWNRSDIVFADCIRERWGTLNLGTPNLSGNFHMDVDIAGWNPLAASTPAVGASPVTFGPYSYKMQISVLGGNITGVTCRGQTTGQSGAGTARDYLLYPGDTCVITYAGAPTVYLQPQ